MGRARTEGDEWLHEVKFDGYRVLAHIDARGVHLITRNGHDWSRYMPALAEDLEHLPRGTVMDGEVVVLDENGVPDFNALERTIRSRNAPVVYQVWDLLRVGGADLRRAPIEARKEELEGLLGAPTHRVRYSGHTIGAGPELFDKIREVSLEGMVSKRLGSRYDCGRRSTTWVKTKCWKTELMPVIGFDAASGLLRNVTVIAPAGADGFRVAGNVGTGFGTAAARKILAELRKNQVPECPIPLVEPPSVHPPCWCQPTLVLEVRHIPTPGRRLLRHASIKRVHRLDRDLQGLARVEPQI